MLLLNGLLVSCSCSSDDSSSSTLTTVVIDSNVPNTLQAGQSAQGTVALSSTVIAATSAATTDVRDITISDTSSCTPKLTFTPNSLELTVDGPAKTFNMSIAASATDCLHVVTFEGAGVSTSTNSSDVNVVTAGTPTAYIVDESDPGDVSKCDIDDTGGLEGCGNEGVTIGAASLNNPVGITIQEIAGENYAYIVNSTAGNVVKCTINEENSLDNCISYTDGNLLDGGNTQGVTVREFGGTNYIYVANSESGIGGADGAIIKCAIIAEGAINTATCTGIGDGGIDTPVGIAFREFNGQVFAYITVDANILKCNTDPGGGIQNACNTSATVAPIGGEPKGIAFRLVGDTTYAYVANSNGFVYKCQADNVGDLSGCVDALALGEDPIPDPNWVTTYAIGDNVYVYITDQGNNNVIVCDLIENGVLNNCRNFGGVVGSPAGIAIVDLP